MNPIPVRRQRIDVLDLLHGLETVVPAAQVEEEELVGGRGRVLGALQVDAANPVPLLLEIAHQMMADEPAGPGDDRSALSHELLL
jgi:hypothetical protein